MTLLLLAGNAPAQTEINTAHLTMHRVIESALGTEKKADQFLALLPDSYLLDAKALEAQGTDYEQVPKGIADLVNALVKVEPIYTPTGKTIGQVLAGISGGESSAGGSEGTGQPIGVKSDEVDKIEKQIAELEERKKATTSAALANSLDTKIAMLRNQQALATAKAQSATSLSGTPSQTPSSPMTSKKPSAAWKLEKKPADWSGPGWSEYFFSWEMGKTSTPSFANRMAMAKGVTGGTPPEAFSGRPVVRFELRLIKISFDSLSPTTLGFQQPPEGGAWISGGNLRKGEAVTGAFPCQPAFLVLMRNFTVENLSSDATDSVTAAIRKGEQVRLGPIGLASVEDHRPTLIPAVFSNSTTSPYLRVVGIIYTLSR